MAEQMSLRTGHSCEAWHSILHAAVHDPALTQMTDGELSLLAESMQSPDQMEWVLELFRDSYMKATEEMPFDFIMRHVNDSGFELTDWISALQLMQQHQKKKGRNSDLAELIREILKTQEKQASKKHRVLAEVVKSALG